MEEDIVPRVSWPLLAAARFGLACIVVSTHLGNQFPHDSPATLLEPFNAAAAVVGFLLISGYSIAHSIEHPVGYLERRARRILPTYLTCLALAVAPFLLWPALAGSEGVPTPEPAQFMASLLLLQGFAATPMACFAPSWSLAVEWWLYVAALPLRKAPEWAIAAIVAVSALCCVRWANTQLQHPMQALPAYAWAWLLGWQLYRKPTALWRHAALLLPAGLVGHFNGPHGAYGAGTVVAVALLLLHGGTVAVKWPRWCNYAGDLSYPLYLCHWPLIAWIPVWWPSAPLWVYLASIAGVTVAVFHLVDRPCRFSRKAPARPPLPLPTS